MSVGLVRLLTHIFKFFLQYTPIECPDGHNSTTNINVNDAVNAVRSAMAHSLSVGHMLHWVLVLRASVSAFQVVFLTGPWTEAMPWRAQYHHKSQCWPGCGGCTSQIWTIFLSVGHILYWVLIMCASLSHFEEACLFLSTGLYRRTKSRARSRRRYLP